MTVLTSSISRTESAWNDELHDRALAKANQVLRSRTDLLRALSALPRKEGVSQAAEHIRRTPDDLATLTVEKLLRRIRSFGSVSVSQTLAHAGVRGQRRLGDLTGGQRAALVSALKTERLHQRATCDCEKCELARIDRLLELERRGIPLPEPKAAHAVRSGLYYPAAPVQAIIDRLLREEELEDVARRIRISDRRLHEYREALVLDEVQVDRVLTAMFLRLEDVYSPELIRLVRDILGLMVKLGGLRMTGRRAPARDVCAHLLRVERLTEGM